MNLKKLINNLLSVFFITFHLFLAVFLIYGLFYIRLLPRASQDLWEHMNSYRLFWIFFTITCIVLNIYNTIQLLGFINKRESSIWIKMYLYPIGCFITYLENVFLHCYKFIWFVLEKVFLKVFHKKHLHYHTLLPVVRSFTNPKYSIYYFIFLFSVKMLPIITLVMALVYDVFFCKRFDYFFRCIPLLLIPLIEPTFLYLMKYYHYMYIYGLNDFFIIVPTLDNTGYNCYRNEEEKDLPYGAKNSDDLFDNHFYPVNQIILTIEKYEAWTLKEIPTYYIQLTLQMLRLITYIYILFYGIL